MKYLFVYNNSVYYYRPDPDIQQVLQVIQVSEMGDTR